MAQTLIDTYGRLHTYLRLSITPLCNLKCFYCVPQNKNTDSLTRRDCLTPDEIFRIAETFVSLGINKIRLTGGEPLVRNDVGDIIQRLSVLPTSLAVSTNGVYLDQYIDLFKKTKLISINVSLDTLIKDKFLQITKHDCFDRVVNNIGLLSKEKIPFKINVVLLKGTNDDEIIDFICWTRNESIEIRFIEFMPFKGNGWNLSEGISFSEVLKKIETYFGNEVIRLEDEKNGTAKKFRIKGFSGTFAFITTVTQPFCESCNRIRVTADGKLKNCLFSRSETDLLSLLRSGKEIIPSILETVKSKEAYRGGMSSLKEFSDPSLNQNNRSMVMIGG